MQNDARTETLLSAEAAPGSAWKDALPRQFGRYRVVARLGAGGMGVVYEGHDPDLQRAVAIKVGLRSRAHDTERFVREARAMAALQHPNVVALYDFGFEDATPYLVLERVQAQSLGALFERFDAQHRRAALREAGAGLRAAHRANIVHRDVKPDNILIGHGGRARLTDFGLAAFGTPESETDPAGPRVGRTGAGLGTLAYMSPEQHLGEPVDPRSDVFSFCVSVVEVLTGVRPFAGATDLEVLDKKMGGPPREALRGMPRRLRVVLMRGLEPGPKDRTVHLEEILRELEPPASTTPVVIFGGGVIGLSTVAVAVMGPSVEPCEPTTRPHWTARDRDTVLREQSSDAAPNIARRVTEKLDAWTASWEAVYVQSCRVESPRRHAWRSCLLDQVSAFESVREPLAAGTTRELRALATADLLPAPSTCTQRGLSVSSTDVAIAEEARRVRSIAADARRRGRPKTSAQRLRMLLPMILEVDDNQTRSRIIAHIGNDLAISGAPVEGRAAMVEALAVPDQPPELEANSALALAWIEGLDLGELDAGFAWLAHAQAIHDRTPLPLHLQGKLLSHEASLRKERGEFDEAIAALERAEVLLDRPEADDRALRRLMTVEFNLGAVFFALGRYAEAGAAFERNAATKASEMGREHPEVADALLAAFRCRLETGQLDKAEAAIERAIEIHTRSLGQKHPSLAATYRHRSELSYARANVGEAIEFLEKAVSILPEASAARLSYEADLATALFDTGDFDESEALATSVLETTESASDPDLAAARASALRCLAEVHRARGDLDAALVAIRRAQVAGAKTSVDEKNSLLLMTTEAEILIAMNRPMDAVALLSPRESEIKQGESPQAQALLKALGEARAQSKTSGTSGSSK